MFSGQYGTDWSALMAATTISILPGVIFYVIFQKGLVQGIALTGMGGR
jgi:multiple sugar transport system permease protein